MRSVAPGSEEGAVMFGLKVDPGEVDVVGRSRVDPGDGSARLDIICARSRCSSAALLSRGDFGRSVACFTPSSISSRSASPRSA